MLECRANRVNFLFDLGATNETLSSGPELRLPKEGEAEWRDLLFVCEASMNACSAVEERRFSAAKALPSEPGFSPGELRVRAHSPYSQKSLSFRTWRQAR
jgi:hypothetical protein